MTTAARSRSRWRRNRRGFALIIVVSLLALLILALVSLATLTRIESQVGINSRKQAQARQNARFALEQALGELQKHAGPDARITATAEIAGVSNANRHWTGVWNLSGGTPQTWLVSGNENSVIAYDPQIASLTFPPSPSALSSGFEVAESDARLLVGPKSAGSDLGAYVVAPLVDLRGPVPGESSDQIIGRYAWWVGDEGVKASIDLVDPLAEAEAASSEGRLRHSFPHRTAIELGTGFEGIDPNDASLQRVIARHQLAYVGDAAPSAGDLRDRFHDFTVGSAGLVVDVPNGRLKRDLSPFLEYGDAAGSTSASGPLEADLVAGSMGADSPRFGLLRSWAHLGDTVSGADAAIAPRVYDPNAEHGAHPIIVRHSWFFGAARYTAASGDEFVRLYLMPLVVLWNPYDIGLEAADYRVELSIPFTFEFFGDASGGYACPPILAFTIPATDFLPGECRAFAAGEWRGYSEGLALGPTWTPTAGFYFDTTAPVVAGGTSVSITQTGPTSLPLGSLVLRIGDSSSADVIHQIDSATGFPSYGVQSWSAVDVPNTDLTGVGPGLYPQMVAHGWYLRRANASSWFPVPASHSPTASTNNWLRINTSTAGRHRAYTGYSWTNFSTSGGQTQCLLFDVLRSDDQVLSLADFQTVQVGGDSWSPMGLFDRSPAIAEALFDGFFLSGLNATHTAAEISNPDFVLPSSRYRIIRRHGEPVVTDDLLFQSAASNPIDRCAAHLLVSGQFNVNSNSAEAWEVVLGALRGVPVAFRNPLTTVGGVDQPISDPIPISRVRYPSNALYVTGNANSLAAWAGGRRISDAQVTQLATYLADHVGDSFSGIKDADTPFLSMGDFASSGVLAAAIAYAGVNSTLISASPTVASGSAGMEIPAWISKWDLLAVLAPVASVRSDTFTIRAYGETVNPLIGDPSSPEYVVARAWCEATVQRIPSPVVVGDDIVQPTGPLGRRFVITSFRWLSPDDI